MTNGSLLNVHEILTLENKAIWTNVDYWAKLCKDLTITDVSFDADVEVDRKLPPIASGGADSRLQARLLEDGYAMVDRINDNQRFDDLTSKLREGITSLHSQNIPATFILLCDETWEYARFAKKILKDSAHSLNYFNFDVLAWYIDPREDLAGFSPHRDRQPDDAKGSFHADGQAKYVTLWTALSPATPENSCLYIIPKQYDPGYLAGDEDYDPLTRALPTKESYQNIRALPRQPGQSVLFTHRILHWGSRGNPMTSSEPRIAISFVCSDPAFERSYINPNYFVGDKMPPFHIRLLLVCAQLLIYYQRFDLPKSCIRACYEYCKEYEAELDPIYRGKVGVEFVKAMREIATTTKAAGCAGTDDEDDDQDDAVLQEMLEAEEQGYGEFEDDYDEMDPQDEISTSENDFDDEDDAQEGGLFGKRKVTVDSNGMAEKKAKG
jgi:ectoine hydroxylase-related dioxygenase (phytanoyl-CoA dioxygenase family)